MPSKSAKQHRLMETVAHDPKIAKSKGIPVAVAQDFVLADLGRHFPSKPSKSVGKPRK